MTAKKVVKYDKNGIRVDAPDWFKRLVEEYNELKEKRTKLGQFLLKRSFPKDVSEAQKILLDRQYHVMCEYATILFTRISLAVGEYSKNRDKNPLIRSEV